MAIGTTLAAIQFGGSLLQKFAGLGSNPEHEANKLRVKEIDMKNQSIRGDNLRISSNYKNRKVGVIEQISNERLAGLQDRGRARLALDREGQKAELENQNDFIKMMQGQKFLPGQGLSRSAAQMMGRQSSARLARLTDANDDFITGSYNRNLLQQNRIKLAKQKVAVKPQFKEYIRSYVPQKSNQTAKMLNFAGGLLGDAASAYGTFDKFKPPTDLNGFDPSIRGFDSSKISIFDYFNS